MLILNIVSLRILVSLTSLMQLALSDLRYDLRLFAVIFFQRSS